MPTLSAGLDQNQLVTLTRSPAFLIVAAFAVGAASVRPGNDTGGRCGPVSRIRRYRGCTLAPVHPGRVGDRPPLWAGAAGRGLVYIHVGDEMDALPPADALDLDTFPIEEVHQAAPSIGLWTRAAVRSCQLYRPGKPDSGLVARSRNHFICYRIDRTPGPWDYANRGLAGPHRLTETAASPLKIKTNRDQGS